jgi:uncharacterized membrane protein YfcA
MDILFSLEWLNISFVIFLSAVLQSTTGFGFALVAVPLLSISFDPHLVIPLVMSVSFISLSLNVKTVWGQTNKKTLTRLLLGSLIGIPIGGLFFYYLDMHILKVFISVTIIVLSLMLVLQNNLSDRFKNVDKIDWLFGSIAGFLTLSVGIPGPPIVLYLIATKTKQEIFRAICITFLFFIYPVTLTVLIWNGSITWSMLKMLLYLVPFCFLGNFVGNRIHHLFSPRTYRILAIVLMFFAGIYSLFNSLNES